MRKFTVLNVLQNIKEIQNSMQFYSITQFQNWTGKTNTEGENPEANIIYEWRCKNPKQNIIISKPELHCEQVYKNETLEHHPCFWLDKSFQQIISIDAEI